VCRALHRKIELICDRNT